jgi:hypothetical protein
MLGWITFGHNQNDQKLVKIFTNSSNIVMVRLINNQIGFYFETISCSFLFCMCMNSHEDELL